MDYSACANLKLAPLTGHWFRALNLRHWKTRLSTDHSRKSPSRFSAATNKVPLYRMLYLGENHQVAIYEVGALLGDPDAPVSNPKGSWALMSVQVTLDYVADLSDVAQQKIIATNLQELTGSWAACSGAAPTQVLGRALHDLPDLEGFIYPSAKAGNRSLAIFVDKLGSRSSLVFRNEINGKDEKLV
jgi:hypothetical protein